MAYDGQTRTLRALAFMLIRQARQLKRVGDVLNARRAAQLALVYRALGRQPAMAFASVR